MYSNYHFSVSVHPHIAYCVFIEWKPFPTIEKSADTNGELLDFYGFLRILGDFCLKIWKRWNFCAFWMENGHLDKGKVHPFEPQIQYRYDPWIYPPPGQIFIVKLKIYHEKFRIYQHASTVHTVPSKDRHTREHNKENVWEPTREKSMPRWMRAENIYIFFSSFFFFSL